MTTIFRTGKQIMKTCRWLLNLAVVLCLVSGSWAQQNGLAAYNEPPSRLRGVIEKYGQDYGSVNRFYTAQTSGNRVSRLRGLYRDYLTLLERLNYGSLNSDEQIDYVLFRNYLDHEQKELTRFESHLGEMRPILPSRTR